MRTFVQKPKATKQSDSVKSSMPSRVLSRQNRDEPFILHLQRTIGNQAVQQLLHSRAEDLEVGPVSNASTAFAFDSSRIPIYASGHSNIQSKLKVGTPGDKCEQEADRVADQVMRMPESQVRRTCACGGGCPKCREQQSGHTLSKTGLARASAAGETPASPIVSKVSRSDGHPLDPATRAFFEPRFGHEFGRVRIHTGADDHVVARSVNARAYTIGQDIVFGDGYYAPETTDGRRLIAHELTHVIQQGASQRHGPLVDRSVGPGIAIRTNGPLIQRQPPTTTPTSTPQQIYSQALMRVQQLDRRMQGFISAAPLNGAQTTILTDSQTNAQGVTTTTTFTLEVKTQNLSNAHAEFRRHPVASPTVSGTTRTRTVNMTLLIDPPTGANAVNDLTETLYHEGLHLLLHMDGFLASGQQSPQGARLAIYRRVAQAHADHAPLLAELDLLVNAHFRAQVAGPSPSGPLAPQAQQRIATLSLNAARSIVTDLIEEKYIEDTVAPAVGRTRQSNANLSLTEIGNDLVNGLGMTQQQLVSATNIAAMRSIINRATQILNAIDQHTGQRRRLPRPPPRP